jgi:hypothetical protein
MGGNCAITKALRRQIPGERKPAPFIAKEGIIAHLPAHVFKTQLNLAYKQDTPKAASSLL